MPHRLGVLVSLLFVGLLSLPTTPAAAEECLTTPVPPNSWIEDPGAINDWLEDCQEAHDAQPPDDSATAGEVVGSLDVGECDSGTDPEDCDGADLGCSLTAYAPVTYNSGTRISGQGRILCNRKRDQLVLSASLQIRSGGSWRTLDSGSVSGSSTTFLHTAGDAYCGYVGTWKYRTIAGGHVNHNGKTWSDFKVSGTRSITCNPPTL